MTATTKLSEPSDIVLEQFLLATDHREQCAIVGRLARHIGLQLQMKKEIVDHGVKSARFVAEARLRGVSAGVLVEKLIDRITADNLFAVILDGTLSREKWLTDQQRDRT